MSTTTILIGLVLLLLVGGGVFAFVVNRSRNQVDNRIDEFVGDDAFVEIPDEIGDKKGPDVADRMDKALSGRSFFGPLRSQISKADVKLRVSEYMVLVVISALGLAAAAYFFMNQSIIFVLIGFVFGLRVPRIGIGMAAKRRMRAFDNQLGDTLSLWVNALRSGYSVLQAMETIATELPPPISKEFERIVQEVRLGLSLEQALDNMYSRVPSEDLDLVITAVNIQREVGGNLAEILDTISFTIRERVRIKGEVRTLTAQGRASGTIISLLPIALTLMLYGVNPEYISQLWVMDAPYIIEGVLPCGWIVLGIGLSMIGAGAFAIMKIVDIEV